MDFGCAIEAVKSGKRASRTGWNGKGQYIELATCISYKNAAGEIVNVNHDQLGNNAIAFIGTSGIQLGWLASQSDMLAEDWQVVETRVDTSCPKHKNVGGRVLFLCDGKACPEDKKRNCFTQQPEERTVNRFTHELDEPCRFTTDIRHAVNFEDCGYDGTAYCEVLKE